MSDMRIVTAAIERSAAASLRGELQRYALRVTTFLPPADGGRKVVHRHGDPFDDSSRKILASRKEEQAPVRTRDRIT